MIRTCLVTEDPNNRIICPNCNSSMAAIRRSTRWQNGRTIRVAFLNGRSDQHSAWQNALQYWILQNTGQQQVNLNFVYVSANEPSDIRVTWQPNQSWSYLGQENIGRNQRSATMSIGDNTIATLYHEIGHMLGLEHEQFNPDVNIQWDIAAVTEWAMRTQGWDLRTIEQNFFRTLNRSSSINTAFDARSVMLYPIDPSFTLDGFSTTLNSLPSATDLSFVRQLYPMPNTNEQPQPGNPNEPNVIVNEGSAGVSAGGILLTTALVAFAINRARQ